MSALPARTGRIANVSVEFVPNPHPEYTKSVMVECLVDILDRALRQEEENANGGERDV